jgi:putative transposase
MDMKKTEKGIKKFTSAEKLSIIKEVKQRGLKVTLAKYDLFPATYYYWKRKYVVYGEEGLAPRTSRDREAKIRRLEKQNEQLKLLLAEKELESKMKDEIIKKKYPEWKRRT